MPIPFPRAMWSRPVLAGLILATLITGCATAPPPLVDAGPAAIGKLSDKAKQEQQQAILKIRNQTIKQIYKLRPAVQKEVDASVGYGVFEVNGLNAVLAESHALYMPSAGENFGHTMLEALTAGRPLLVSDRTPWRGLAAEHAGWDLPLDRPEAFTETVERLCAMDQAEYDGWSAGARERAMRHLDDKASVEASLRLFKG